MFWTVLYISITIRSLHRNCTEIIISYIIEQYFVRICTGNNIQCGNIVLNNIKWSSNRVLHNNSYCLQLIANHSNILFNSTLSLSTLFPKLYNFTFKQSNTIYKKYGSSSFYIYIIGHKYIHIYIKYIY